MAGLSARSEPARIRSKQSANSIVDILALRLDDPQEPVAITLDPIEEAIAAIARGEMVVVVDDADRENEGDLVMAADAVTAQAINFMATEGRGLICVSLPGERLQELALPQALRRQHRLHVHGLCHHPRSARGHDHRHFRLGPGADHPGAGRRGSRRPISTAPAMSFRCAPIRRASSAGPAIPRRRWILRGWPGAGRRGCCARSRCPTARWRGCPTCSCSPAATG